jgi:carbamoyltransferase
MSVSVPERGPLALGIHCGHDSSVSICSPQGIIFSVQEERLSRIKHHFGFPAMAVTLALKYCGLTAADISLVAFTTKNVLFPEHPRRSVVQVGNDPSAALRREGWSSKVLVKTFLRDWVGLIRVPAVARCRRAKERRAVRHDLGEFAERHWTMYLEYLGDLGLFGRDITHYYVEHHLAHAASAFRLSGIASAAVVTIDGHGDGVSATIFLGAEDGTLHLFRKSPLQDSLGLFYQAVTEALGFIPVDGEYKTMGLAALGAADSLADRLGGVVRVEDGRFLSSARWRFRDFNSTYPSRRVPNPLPSVSQADQFRALLGDLGPEQLAQWAQASCEKNMVAYAKDALKITGCESLVGAGGVMLNVKGNTRIVETCIPTQFFVYPDSGDSGLAAGAAMEALHQSGSQTQGARFFSPYLGHSFNDFEIRNEIARYKERWGVVARDANLPMIAELLTQGAVIGTFQGRMEMGPRALGNRSVLADPRRVGIKERINSLLKGREPFVPFAPSVLVEDVALYWQGPSDHYYMTATVDATPFARRAVPAVVHVDGSMRPQVVSREVCPWFHTLLSEFKARSGVGVLLNTSFNRHGHPIVGSPADALDHLVRGWVDGVFLGPWYVARRDAR